MILSVARAGVNVGPLEVAARQQSIDPNVRPIALALLDAIRRSGRRTVDIWRETGFFASQSAWRMQKILSRFLHKRWPTDWTAAAR